MSRVGDHLANDDQAAVLIPSTIGDDCRNLRASSRVVTGRMTAMAVGWRRIRVGIAGSGRWRVFSVIARTGSVVAGMMRWWRRTDSMHEHPEGEQQQESGGWVMEHVQQWVRSFVMFAESEEYSGSEVFCFLPLFSAILSRLLYLLDSRTWVGEWVGETVISVLGTLNLKSFQDRNH